VFGGTVGVILVEICEALVELAALSADAIICRTSVSVDCQRTCMMSAHAVEPAPTFIVVSIGSVGTGPRWSVEVEYTLVTAPRRVLAQNKPFTSGLGPVPTK
jgi:hypothetical protein